MEPSEDELSLRPALQTPRLSQSSFYKHYCPSQWGVLAKSGIEIKYRTIVILLPSLAIHLPCENLHRKPSSRDTVKKHFKLKCLKFQKTSVKLGSLASSSWSTQACQRMKAFISVMCSMQIKESSHKTSVLIKAVK